MTFLAFWSPSAFTAVLDYCEATAWGWTGPGPDPDDDDDRDGGPAPVCGQCGGNLGIFLKFGLDWRHYRGEGLDDIELYDPGHAPMITWRAPASPARRPADTRAPAWRPRARSRASRGAGPRKRLPTANLLACPRYGPCYGPGELPRVTGCRLGDQTVRHGRYRLRVAAMEPADDRPDDLMTRTRARGQYASRNGAGR